MSSQTVEEFRKLMPEEMRAELKKDPLMDQWVKRLREQPADTPEAVQLHIDWFLENLLREGFDPREVDPNSDNIRLMMLLAQERIAEEDGLAVIAATDTRN